MIKKLLLWARDERGATVIEYSLIVAGVALVVVGAVFGLGHEIEGVLSALRSYLDI